MKKSLAILLTLIFTFSCFSVLGTGMVFAETVQPPYISVVDTDGNPHKYGADIGAKVDVKANEDGSNTFTLTYDNMDSTNVFMGWYDGDSLYDFNHLVQGDLTLTAKYKKQSGGCGSSLSASFSVWFLLLPLACVFVRKRRK